MALCFLGTVLYVCEAKEQVVTFKGYSFFAVAFFVFVKIRLRIFARENQCQQPLYPPAITILALHMKLRTCKSHVKVNCNLIASKDSGNLREMGHILTYEICVIDAYVWNKMLKAGAKHFKKKEQRSNGSYNLVEIRYLMRLISISMLL